MSFIFLSVSLADIDTLTYIFETFRFLWLQNNTLRSQ